MIREEWRGLLGLCSPDGDIVEVFDDVMDLEDFIKDYGLVDYKAVRIGWDGELYEL